MPTTNTITQTTTAATNTYLMRLQNENEAVRTLREEATEQLNSEQLHIPRLSDEISENDREAEFLNLIESRTDTEEFRRNLLEAIAARRTDVNLFRDLIRQMDEPTTQWILDSLSQSGTGVDNFAHILNIMRIAFALGMTDSVMITQEIFSTLSEQSAVNLEEFTERTNEIGETQLENAEEADNQAREDAEDANERGRRDRALALGRHRFRSMMVAGFTSLVAAGGMYMGFSPQAVIPLVRDTVLGTVGVRPVARPTTSNNSLLGTIFQSLADYFNNK